MLLFVCSRILFIKTCSAKSDLIDSLVLSLEHVTFVRWIFNAEGFKNNTITKHFLLVLRDIRLFS